MDFGYSRFAQAVVRDYRQHYYMSSARYPGGRCGINRQQRLFLSRGSVRCGRVDCIVFADLTANPDYVGLADCAQFRRRHRAASDFDNAGNHFLQLRRTGGEPNRGITSRHVAYSTRRDCGNAHDHACALHAMDSYRQVAASGVGTAGGYHDARDDTLRHLFVHRNRKPDVRIKTEPDERSSKKVYLAMQSRGFRGDMQLITEFRMQALDYAGFVGFLACTAAWIGR